MLRILSAVFVVLHGLVHMWYVALSQGWVEFEPEMGWTGESWLLSRFLGESATRSLASIVFIVATLAFVVSGVGTLFNAGWWRSALLASAIFSTAMVVLYWDGSFEMIVQKGLIALLINAGILVAVLLVR
ncbi:MAG: hypothetical protein PVI59_09345 [Anaerolineae bacterium]